MCLFATPTGREAGEKARSYLHPWPPSRIASHVDRTVCEIGKRACLDLGVERSCGNRAVIGSQKVTLERRNVIVAFVSVITLKWPQSITPVL